MREYCKLCLKEKESCQLESELCFNCEKEDTEFAEYYFKFCHRSIERLKEDLKTARGGFI